MLRHSAIVVGAPDRDLPRSGGGKMPGPRELPTIAPDVGKYPVTSLVSNGLQRLNEGLCVIHEPTSRARTLSTGQRPHPGVAGIHPFPWSHSRRGSFDSATADCRMALFPAGLGGGSVGPRGRANAVLLVKVAAELHDPVRRRPGRHVREIERHRFLEPHIPALPRFLHMLNVLLLPPLVGQHPSRQLFDAMHAHTARTRGAEIAAE